jgi:hypothetical protein
MPLERNHDTCFPSRTRNVLISSRNQYSEQSFSGHGYRGFALNRLQRDETPAADPGPQRHATVDFRLPRISYWISAANGLPVSACSFTQSCRGCLQSKPAGEVIDSFLLLNSRLQSGTESEKSVATYNLWPVQDPAVSSQTGASGRS